jgi:hypothetical protein
VQVLIEKRRAFLEHEIFGRSPKLFGRIALPTDGLARQLPLDMRHSFPALCWMSITQLGRFRLHVRNTPTWVALARCKHGRHNQTQIDHECRHVAPMPTYFKIFPVF